MFLIALIVVLLILVIWFGSTSYAPKAILGYFYLSFMPKHPQMQSEIDRSGASLWQIATIGAKKGFAEQINMELEELRISKALAPKTTVTTAATVQPAVTTAATVQPTVQPTATTASAGSANAAPTPVVEKFRTNMAYMYGSEHA